MPLQSPSVEILIYYAAGFLLPGRTRLSAGKGEQEEFLMDGWMIVFRCCKCCDVSVKMKSGGNL